MIQPEEVVLARGDIPENISYKRLSANGKRRLQKLEKLAIVKIDRSRVMRPPDDGELYLLEALALEASPLL